MKILSSNKNANRNYEIIKSYEAGISLFGTEVKSISRSNCSINEAYVIIKQMEVFIINMYVAPFKEGNIQNKDPIRTRKLLLNKNEILKIDHATKKEGLTIIPIKFYWRHQKLKLEIALAKGKKLHDKRASEKQKEISRYIKAH